MPEQPELHLHAQHERTGAIQAIHLRHRHSLRRLVDVVVVTPDGRAAADQVQGIERRLGELSDRRARVLTPMERDRRARAIQVLTLIWLK